MVAGIGTKTQFSGHQQNQITHILMYSVRLSRMHSKRLRAQNQGTVLMHTSASRRDLDGSADRMPTSQRHRIILFSPLFNGPSPISTTRTIDPSVAPLVSRPRSSRFLFLSGHSPRGQERSTAVWWLVVPRTVMDCSSIYVLSDSHRDIARGRRFQPRKTLEESGFSGVPRPDL